MPGVGVHLPQTHPPAHSCPVPAPAHHCCRPFVLPPAASTPPCQQLRALPSLLPCRQVTASLLGASRSPLHGHRLWLSAGRGSVPATLRSPRVQRVPWLQDPALHLNSQTPQGTTDPGGSCSPAEAKSHLGSSRHLGGSPRSNAWHTGFSCPHPRVSLSPSAHKGLVSLSLGETQAVIIIFFYNTWPKLAGQALLEKCGI